MSLEGALPRSLTSRRLREILGLTKQQINRLAKALNDRAAGTWQAEGYNESEFGLVLADFIATKEGLEQFQEAAREVEEKVPKWHLTLDAGIFHSVLDRFLDDPEFRTIFPDGQATRVEPGDHEDIRRFLAEGEHWPQLAEFAWATALGSGSTAFLEESTQSYIDVAAELSDVLASMGGRGAVADAQAEAEPAEGGESEDGDSSLGEAEAVVKSIREHVRKIRADAPDLALLDELAADVGKLRDLAAEIKQEREVEILLAKFDGVSANFTETIEALEIGGKLEGRRGRMANRGQAADEAETWIDGLAVLLDLIDRLNREIQELLTNIRTAAADNDLDAIQRHTEAAQTKKTDLEDKVRGLKDHLSA